jgi:hypothetical protein
MHKSTDYEEGYRDALNGRNHLRLSNLYNTGFTDGLTEKFTRKMMNENHENLHMIDKHSGEYEEK